MISKELFITKLQNEVEIIKHLASKATAPELLDFKFSDPQRTTAQRLAYIALIWSACTQDIIHDDNSKFAVFNQKYEQFDPTTFADSIDHDLNEIITIVQSVDENKFKEEKTLRGKTDTRAGHMMWVYNLYIAYKTQIFLQLKAAGLTNLGTMNLWAGMDAPTSVE